MRRAAIESSCGYLVVCQCFELTVIQIEIPMLNVNSAHDIFDYSKRCDANFFKNDKEYLLSGAVLNQSSLDTELKI